MRAKPYQIYDIENTSFPITTTAFRLLSIGQPPDRQAVRIFFSKPTNSDVWFLHLCTCEGLDGNFSNNEQDSGILDLQTCRHKHFIYVHGLG